MNEPCVDALIKANEAHSMAQIVSIKHDTHELTCARRYQDWRDSTETLNDTIIRLDEKMSERISGIYRILWSTSATTILTLIGAVGAMAFFLLTKNHNPLAGN